MQKLLQNWSTKVILPWPHVLGPHGPCAGTAWPHVLGPHGPCAGDRMAPCAGDRMAHVLGTAWPHVLGLHGPMCWGPHGPCAGDRMAPCAWTAWPMCWGPHAPCAGDRMAHVLGTACPMCLDRMVLCLECTATLDPESPTCCLECSRFKVLGRMSDQKVLGHVQGITIIP